jgi:hypothetical protein
MLPGFRFLFAAIVLCFSILVFGLGAAALLRAAHEEFASKPSWRGTPETMFGQQNEVNRPVLALLQVEPEAKAPATDVTKEPVSEPVAPQSQDDAPTAAAAPEPAAAPSPAPEPQKVAALSAPEAQKPTAPKAPEEMPAEAAKSEPAVPEPAEVEDGKSQSSLGEQATVERSSSPPKVSSGEHDAGIATSEDATPKATEPPPRPSEPMNTPAPASQADPLGAKIAALEAADVQGPQKKVGVINAAPDKNAIWKRLRARRTAAVKERRRLTMRARVVQQAPVQPQQFLPLLPPFVMEPGPNTQTH